MSDKYCRGECETRTTHKPFQTGLYTYNGETVYVCRTCGHLRTQSEMQIVEAEMIHKPTQKKYKEIKK